MTTAAPHDPTADIPVDPNADGRGVWVRRGFLSLLALLVVLALFGFFGIHSRTVSASSPHGDMTVEVHYAQVARAGLAVPFQVTVRRPSGFDGDVTVAVSSLYPHLFDRNSLVPPPPRGPARERAAPRRVG